MTRQTLRSPYLISALAGFALSAQVGCGAQSDDPQGAAAGEIATLTQGITATAGYLWAWSSSPTGSYTAQPSYSYSSRGGAIQIANLAPGRYQVTAPGFSDNAGNVQVAAYGGGAERCKVASWGVAAATLSLDVRCHDPAGAPVNTLFVAQFKVETATVAGARWGAYLWADDAASQGCYVPPAAYQWNAAGAANRVCRGSGPGSYSAYLTGQSSGGGTVLVTAYGTGAEYCKVGSFVSSGGDTVASVQCFNAAGAPADSRFSLSYFSSTEILSVPSGHVWANNTTAAAYTPALPYQANSLGGTNTAGHGTGPGAYLVRFPKLRATGASAWPFPFSSSAMVTAYGTGAQHCKLAGWGNYGDGSQVNVRCYAPGGAPVDTQFTAAFINNDFPAPQ